MGLLPTAALAADEESDAGIAPLADLGATTITSDTTWSNANNLAGDLTIASGVTLTIGAKVTISGDVTISGGGTIQRGESYRDELISVPTGANLTLQNIIIDGGADTASNLTADEAAIRVEEGTVTLNAGAVIQNNNHVSVEDNSYQHASMPRYYNMGGGIAVYGGTLTMNNGSQVKNNAVTNTNYSKSNGTKGNSDSLGGGVAIYENGTFIMNGGEISGNSAAVSGGEGRAYGGGVGLMSRGANSEVITTPDNYKITFTMSGGTISHNSAANGGGGIYGGVDQGDTENQRYTHLDITISGEITENESSSNGGGIQVGNAELKITDGAEISSNSAVSGGGILVGSASHFTMSGGSVSNNAARGDKNAYGGGIYLNSNANSVLEITGGEITGNSADDSGGGVQITTDRTVEISNCTITGNTCGRDGEGTAVANGGGIQANPGVVLTLTNCTITDNTSKTGHGGGLYISGPKNQTGGTTTLSGTTVIDGNHSSLSGPNMYVGNLDAQTALTDLGGQSKIGITWNVGTGFTDEGGKAVISGATETAYSCIVCENEDYYVLRRNATDNTGALKAAIVVTLHLNDPTIGTGGDHTGEQTAKFLTLANEEVNSADLVAACGFKKDGYLVSGWGYNRIGQETSDQNYRVQFPLTFSEAKDLYALWIPLNSFADISMEYGSERTVGTSAGDITYSGWTSSDDDVATVDSSGKITATGVGDATIHVNATSTSGGDVAKQEFKVTVIPMNITFGSGENENPSATLTHVYDGNALDYFDYAAFYPATIGDSSVSVVPGSKKVDLEAGTDVVFVYDDGSGNGAQEHNALPVEVTGSEGMEVTVKLKNDNYRFVTDTNRTPTTELALVVKIHAQNMDKVDLYIEDQKVDAIPGTTVKVWNGEGQAPISDLTGVKAEGIETFTVHFHPLNSNTHFTETHLEDQLASELTSENVLAIAPTEPGQYLMIVNGITEAAADANGKYAYASAVFSIEKATVTIKAEDVTVYVGDEMPTFTYTVNGLVKDEHLDTEGITLSCPATNTNTAGAYAITPSGGTIEDTDHYNDIVYKPGTLTVRTRSSGDSSGATYTVNAGNSNHGTVAVSPKNARYGATVTLTVTPDEGYVLSALAVTDKNGETVKLTKKSDTQYTFTMPRSAVTVEATFAPETAPDIPAFSDVPADAYYADAVAWAVENGVTNGVSDTAFGPDVSCTRAQMVTFLWRAAGSPKPVTAVNPFADVSASAYYYDAVLWAVENGVTNGTSDTAFSPDATVTRGQSMTFIWRANGSPAVGSGSFSDVPADAYYTDAVAWAVENGITNGISATAFGPDNACTRAQIVTFLYRVDS